jgi:hypothetical protein
MEHEAMRLQDVLDDASGAAGGSRAD